MFYYYYYYYYRNSAYNAVCYEQHVQSRLCLLPLRPIHFLARCNAKVLPINISLSLSLSVILLLYSHLKKNHLPT